MHWNSPPRAGLLAACLSAALVLAACGQSPAAAPSTPAASGSADPARAVTDFVGRLKPSAPYRDPTGEERRRTLDAVDLLLDDPSRLGEATALLTQVGYAGSAGTDPDTGRRYAMFTTEAGSDRAWGMLLVDLSRPPKLAIEVPHPNSDLRTEDIGLRLFQAVPGSVLLVAGAHRRAGDQRADAAHNADGMFQVITGRFARQAVNQIQLHGFAEQSLPDEDAVISSGQRRSSPPLRRAADALNEAGFVTCRAWAAKCGQLEGTTNSQAEEARRQGSVFIHLEVTWAVRRDESRRADLVEALVAADLPRD
jgi:hypothetical protein